jgi:hypothetical protein
LRQKGPAFNRYFTRQKENEESARHGDVLRTDKKVIFQELDFKPP